MGDLSFHNCIVTADRQTRLIDLEAAVEEGLDLPMDIRTPGFASASSQRHVGADARAEDGYAFGANLAAAMMPVNAMLPLDRDVASRFARRMCADMGYPLAIADIIEALLQKNAARRPSPVSAMAALWTTLTALPRDTTPVPWLSTPPSDPADAATSLFAYIDARSQTARPDRYVPGGPEVFETQPWGVAHGAAGVMHAYLRGGRVPPPTLLPYLLEGCRRAHDRGTSLMTGDAGIAWVLFEAGQGEEAANLLRRRPADERIREYAGLHEGLAGWGLARIKAWHETADPHFLLDAASAGEALLESATVENELFCWRQGAKQPVGLAHGAAGVALFLLHLHAATGDERFLRAARGGLAFDLAQREVNPDGDPSWPKEAGGATTFPYLRHGTAGILAVAIRFFVYTGERHYLDVVLSAEDDLLRRHAISPGLFDGLAGIGETLLDLATWLPDRAATYLTAARCIAGGIEPFFVRGADGLAVPGAELLRFSCDFATGNAGVAAFHDRLWRGGPASFMLDEHLPVASLKKWRATA